MKKILQWFDRVLGESKGRSTGESRLRPEVESALKAVEGVAQWLIKWCKDIEDEDTDIGNEYEGNDPSDYPIGLILTHLALAYRALGREADAEPLFAEAIRIMGEHGGEEYDATVCLLFLSGHEEVVRETDEKTLSEYPIRVQQSLLAKQSAILKGIGRYSAAAAQLAKMQPGSERDRNYAELAATAAEAGELDEARASAGLSGDRAYAWASFALGAGRANRFIEAREALDKATAHLPPSLNKGEHEALLEVLGRAYAACGITDKAAWVNGLLGYDKIGYDSFAEETTEYYLRTEQLGKAVGGAEQVGILADPPMRDMSHNYLTPMAKIATAYAKKGDTKTARAMLGVARKLAKKEANNRFALHNFTLVDVAQAFVESGLGEEAVVVFAEVYRYYVKDIVASRAALSDYERTSNIVLWVVPVTKAITTQVNAGLATLS